MYLAIGAKKIYSRTIMQHPIVQDFVKKLNGDTPFLFHGPYSPMIFVRWTLGPDANGRDLVIAGVSKGRETFGLVSEQVYKGYAKSKFAQFLEGKVTLKQLEADYEKDAAVIDKIYTDFYSKEIAHISDTDLAAFFKKIADALSTLIDTTLYIETFDRDIALQVLADDELINSVWKHAADPLFLSFDVRWAEAVEKALLSASLDEAVKKCRYVFNDYYMSKTVEEVKKELELLQGKHTHHSAEAETLRQGLKDKINAFTQWVETLSPRQRALAEYTQFVMKLRDLRKDPFGKVFVVFPDCARELGKRAGIPAECVPLINAHEYAKGISWLTENKEELCKRKNGLVDIIYSDGTFRFETCDFEATKSQLEALLNVEKTQEIKGSVGYAGKIQGKVRVVIDPFSAPDFEPGSILVTNMTRPDFLPLMKKAGAFVTNEGGITCHAAIIAREMKKPCVIGTKIATQILKDGDLVEVDAEKGMVSLISR